ncbi:Hint domain-containing protein [Acidimangrovimonas sediminis]|uniref:Hint domain-containing protein n=1 Tax=Acidimangrovimonas sediminis TaxID=2056283 RepID=UPI000C800306|nr:Hint domain-containing protein [Acidimangrovimonas sediminis]
MATYPDKFYEMDPGNPPSSGTELNTLTLDYTDANNDGYLSPSSSNNYWWNQTSSDTINGEKITAVWVGDTVTVVDNATGETKTVTGVTFYTSDGHQYFTPTDGSNLHDATFVKSTYVNQSTKIPLKNLGTPCFVAGTLIRTPEGLRPVETLLPGDLVVTHDNGVRPLRWIGSRTVPGMGTNTPVRFARGAIGNARDLYVSPQHRMLISGWRAELLCGEDEVLAAALHMVNGDTITRAPRREVTYVHLLFDRHEIVEAEGVPSESFHPGDYILSGDTALREELVSLFPELGDLSTATGWHSARTILKAHEAQLLSAAA